MCEAYPQRRPELDLYKAYIGTIYEHYGYIFYLYHRQFTKKAAAYLEKGIKIDWSKRDNDLFQLVVGGTKTKMCDHCLLSDHQSTFCPTQYNITGSSSLGRKQNDTLKVKSTDPKTERRGRSTVVFQGKEICNNFNSNSCRHTQATCPFATCANLMPMVNLSVIHRKCPVMAQLTPILIRRGSRKFPLHD